METTKTYMTSYVLIFELTLHFTHTFMWYEQSQDLNLSLLLYFWRSLC